MAKGQKFGGRKAGTPNKATRDIREAFRALLEANLDRMQAAFATLWEERPDQALRHMTALAEFCIPRLARTEVTGEEGHALKIEIVRFSPSSEAEQSPGEPDGEAQHC